MSFQSKQKKQRLHSIQFIGIIMFILLLTVATCLFWRGLFDTHAAALKHYRTSNPDVILPMRGKIIDRNGHIFAQSKEAYTLHYNPQEMENPELFINQITPVLDLDEEKALEKMEGEIEDTSRRDGIVFEKMTELQMERIKKLVKDSSICNYNFSIDQKREYPKGSMAAALIGWVGHDNIGLSGLEISYNTLLSGIPGRKIYNRNFSGNKVPGSEEVLEPPVHGKNIVLTIDDSIQAKVESIIENHVEKNQAKGGVGIVMDPETGEILAMTSYPSFDLNEGNDYILDPTYSNRAVAMNYEPGSIFKGVTASAALELGYITPEDQYTCEGRLMVENKPIQCMFVHGKQKLADYLKNSCNCVFAQIGIKMGFELLDFVERFQFGKKYPLHLGEQEAGILPDRDWFSDLEAANISFGTSISVTPLQIINAYAAIINGGNLMKPLLVKEIQDNSGKTIETFQPQILKKVISKETSSEMVAVLQNVVQGRNGCSAAKIKGVPVGGKTGTAKKTLYGQYQDDKVICSFVGFFPADDPKYLVLVSIDEPQPAYTSFGSTVAAPAFRDIAQWLLLMGEQNCASD